MLVMKNEAVHKRLVFPFVVFDVVGFSLFLTDPTGTYYSKCDITGMRSSHMCTEITECFPAVAHPLIMLLHSLP